jgi:hypothetical protein
MRAIPVLAALVSGAVVAAALPGLTVDETDPSSLPIPVVEFDDPEKAVVVRVRFDDRTHTTVQSTEMVLSRAHGRTGEPPLLRVRLSDENGAVIEQFNAWHPLWKFAEDPGGEESRIILPSAEGRFVVPFSPGLNRMALTDVALDQQVADVDLAPAIREFCDQTPTDPDCDVYDLEVVSVAAVDPPTEVLIGQPAAVTVRTVVANRGPDEPTDAVLTLTAEPSPGITVTPADSTRLVEDVAIGAEPQNDEPYTVTCSEPGVHTVTFRSDAALPPLPAAATDPGLSNNSGQATLSVDCVTPVAINIHPGQSPNPVNLGSGGAVPLAVLSTSAGQYGLPTAFDATTIDPLSVRFGRESIVTTGGGAAETHNRGHIEDAYELDEATLDGDMDMVLHFRLTGTGLTAGDTKACVKGKWRGAGGTLFTFFGCDSILIVP